MEYLKYIDATIIIILIIVFFSYFFYNLLFNTNKIISYKVIENPYEEDYIIKKKPVKNTCREKCKGKVCCDYEKKREDYNNCTKCKNKFMCYNKNTNSCELCLSGMNCDKYSCNKKEPINPKDNYCILC